MSLDVGFFVPFIEAPSVPPPKPAPGTSGSYTVDIDHLRQGVEITTDAQRYNGTLPRFETDDPEHEIQINTFGQSSEFAAVATFGEINRFDPVVFIRDSSALTFPVVLDSPSYEDPEKLGGVVQPLAIGSKDLLVSNTEFEPNDIKGHLMDGNESVFRNVDRIVSSFDPREPVQVTNLYIDASDSMGVAGGSITLGGVFPEAERVIRPFDESKFLSRSVVSGSLPSTGSYDVVAALVLMGADDDNTYVPDGYISAGKGFTYDGAPMGTDSLAFGGLKRS